MSDLEEAVEAGSLVLVVGAGVSAAATSQSPTATWRGLIESGRDRAVRLNPSLAQKWQGAVDQQIDLGVSGMEDSLTQAAGMVARQLKSHGTQAYADWLKEDVGSFRVSDRRLVATLAELPYPILTTNYDTLIEDAARVGRASATWLEPSEMQRLISGLSRKIGHMHGVWRDPESVILSEGDYARLAAAESAQTLERALSGTKSIMYIGFGAGFGDPNFTALLSWHREIFPVSGVRHFRLCRADEVDELERLHAPDNISAISYGSDYADLPAFLKTLAPRQRADLSTAGVVRDVVGEAQESMMELLVADAVIAEHMDGTTADIVEGLRPPVLLPVPYANYVAAKSAKSEKERVERLDPYREAAVPGVMVVVGEDEAGLTTALRWLTWQGSVARGDVAPLYINFTDCRPTSRPLEQQVGFAARLQGLTQSKRAQVPPHVLALDDFSPYAEGVSQRVVTDLSRSTAPFIAIGCKQGAEDDLLARLEEVGLTARVRYLGRLGSADVERLARSARPAGAGDLAASVVSLLRSENLPRTPFSVSLLISILLRGGAVAANASQAGILDQYVSLLLGRGDPHEDARFSVDLAARDVLLSNLAQTFIERGTAGLPEGAVVASLDEVIHRFGWSESPSALFASFMERRVLRRVGSNIVFGRSSYLYLFAAKRAVASESFRSLLAAQPLYYANVLKYYAALLRRDAGLLESVAHLLEEFDQAHSETRSPFESIEPVPIDEEAFSGMADENENDDAEADDAATEVRPFVDDGFLDGVGEDEPPPFPGDSGEDMPVVPKFMKTLDLVSSVLRDSDQIEDLDMKQRILVSTLGAWGSLVGALTDDVAFQAFVKSLVEDLAIAHFESAHLSESKATDMMGRMVPGAIALGGVGETLASRRLLAIFNTASLRGHLRANQEVTLGSAFFVFALREEGWASQLEAILLPLGNTWIVRNLLLQLLLQHFVYGNLTRGEEDELLTLCTGLVMQSVKSSSTAHSEKQRQAVRTRLANQRRQSRRQRLSQR